MNYRFAAPDAGFVFNLAYLAYWYRFGFVVNIFLFPALGTFEEFKVIQKTGTTVDVSTVPELPFFTRFVTDGAVHKNFLMAAI